MKIDKKIQKKVEKMAQVSFGKNGEILTSLTRQSLKILKELPKSKAVPALTLFLKLLKNRIKRQTLEVYSSSPLSFSELSALKKGLEQNYRFKDVSQQKDESLIAGIRVKIGDVVLDSSLRSRVYQVKEAIHG